MSDTEQAGEAAHPAESLPAVDDVPVKLVPAELIQTAEVDERNDDRLAHAQIAQQLADLATTVADRSNIALYGAWGSGKSSIGNLVRAELKHRKGIGFARFDAFKYAENPLRRNFISAVATDLGVKDDPRFHSDLYAGKTKTTFDIPKESVFKIAAAFFGLAFLVCLSLLILAAGVAFFQSGHFTDNLRALSRQAVISALTPAALLSSLIVLAGKSLGVERKTDKAESSEQFESLFNDLIKEAGKKRVVVFVDELDRCAPEEVVATLDAVRTFFGVTGCVFIVAADPAAIEEALGIELKQATPADRVNPYYSSGSAYLDKVFHHQIFVPPLLQASVTRYAVDLVRGRPGVWTELGDRLDVTVSVAVPSHVRSPRRVKVLLNAFVLSYRLAEARQLSGLLDGDMRDRADEIARLVCLRTEFPLFARDLVLDARLPDYVLLLDSGETPSAVWKRYPHATEQVRELAEAYAGARLPVAGLLTNERDDQDEDPDDHDDEQADAAYDEPVQQQAEQDVKHALGRQLLDYLSRTQSVSGPSRDLLYMQSTGSAVGLDGELAERIEQSARDAAVRELLASTQALDTEEHDAVITLLIEQSRRALGLEARNVAVSLLAVAGVSGFDVASRADALADALAPAVNAEPSLIDAASLPGAWRLGLHSDRPSAQDLRRLVIRSDAARDQFEIAMLVIREPEAALDADPETTARLFAANLLSPSGQAADGTARVVLALEPAVAVRLLSTSAQVLSAGLRALFSPAATTAPSPAPASASARTLGSAAAAATAAEDESDAVDPAPVVAALTMLLDELDDAVAQVLLGIVLDVDIAPARDLAQASLALVGSVDDPALAAKVVRGCGRRALAAWPEWIAPLTPAAVTHDSLDSPLQYLVNQLWEKAANIKNRPSADVVTVAAASVVGLLEHREESTRPSPAEAIAASLGASVTDNDTAAARQNLLGVATELVRAGAVAPGQLAAKETTDLPGTLRLGLAEQGIDDPIVVYVMAAVLDSLRGWEQPGVPGQPPAPQQARDLVDAVYECAWLPEPDATRLRLLARATLPAGAEGLPALPEPAALNALRAEHDGSLDDAIAAWIGLAEPDPESLLAAAAAALAGSPSAALLSAFRHRTDEMPPKDRVDVLRGLLGDVNAAPPSSDVLAAAGAASLPDIEVARVLVGRHDQCSTLPQKRHVLEAWERARVQSDAARKLLFQSVLVPLFASKDNGGGAGAAALGLDFLPRLAKTRPSGMKTVLRDVVVRAVGEERAAKPLGAIGYRVSKSWLGLKTNIDGG